MDVCNKNHHKLNKNRKKNISKENLSYFYPNYENIIHKKRG